MSERKDDGGPAFPLPQAVHPFEHAFGMTLRDWFATAVDKNEYGDLLYRNASNALMEALVGPAPEKPDDRAPREVRVAYQLAHMDWELRFRAAIRSRLADAMLAARKVEP